MTHKSDNQNSEALRPAGSVTRKLVYSLALIPIVPTISIVGVTVIDSYLGLVSFDPLRWFHFFYSVMWVTLTIVIWRRMIVWTLGKKWLTLLIGMIPFIQVVYANPLWTISEGCFSFNNELLQEGQHEIGIGFWVWISVWVWWGWEKYHMNHSVGDNKRVSRSMTPTAMRLAASIGSIPFIFGVFLITMVIFSDIFQIRDAIPECFSVCAAVAVMVWILIWRNVVSWTAEVIRQTILLLVLCFAIPVVLQYVFIDFNLGDLLGMVLFTLPIIGWGTWMALTVNIWPGRVFTSTYSDATPRCMNCGYILNGLRSTRCPECGDEPTLDELWVSTMEVV